MLDHVVQHMKDPLGFFVRERARHGDLVTFSMGKRPLVLLSHPDHARHVLVDNASNYAKSPEARRNRRFGRGLFPSDGEHWRRQRRMAQPAFSRERLAALVDTLVDSTRSMLARWEEHARTGEPIELSREMSRITLSQMGRAVLTEDMNETRPRVRDGIRFIMTHDDRDRSLWDLVRIPRPSWKRYAQAIAALDEMIYEVIAQRHQSPGAPDDMLSLLMAARDVETGEGMNDELLRDEVMNLFVGGHEATATALAWTWYQIRRHPQVEQRMRQEIAEVLGEREPGVRDLPNLRYTTQVFQESMRLLPPAWLVGRVAMGADRIGGWDIPPGATVGICTYLLHRHPDFWEDVETFDPERFDPERVAKRHRHAYMPFGAGQRLCIGNHLAQMQATVVLAMGLRRFRMEMQDTPALVLKAGLTLRARHGIQVRLERQSVG